MLMQALQSLLTETVSIERWTGQDRYGQPVYGTRSTYRARVEVGLRRVKGEQGEDLTAHLTIYVGEPVLVDPRDRVTLDAKFGTRDTDGTFEAPRLVLVQAEPVYDITGHVATILRCGRG